MKGLFLFGFWNAVPNGVVCGGFMLRKGRLLSRNTAGFCADKSAYGPVCYEYCGMAAPLHISCRWLPAFHALSYP